jgi:hypothetical protein
VGCAPPLVEHRAPSGTGGHPISEPAAVPFVEERRPTLASTKLGVCSLRKLLTSEGVCSRSRLRLLFSSLRLSSSSASCLGFGFGFGFGLVRV